MRHSPHSIPLLSPDESGISFQLHPLLKTSADYHSKLQKESNYLSTIPFHLVVTDENTPFDGSTVQVKLVKNTP